jgi:DNA-directed RNA polymerase specialized sigma54-like protein
MLSNKAVLRKLLEGYVICPITDNDGFQWLRSEDGSEMAQQVLEPLGIELRLSRDETYARAVYAEISPSMDGSAIKAHAQDIIGLMKPLLAFLETVSSATAQDVYLYYGQSVRFSEIFVGIENNISARESFTTVLKSKAFKSASSKTSVKDQLGAVLSSLCDDGYLQNNGSDVDVDLGHYTVTGKFAYATELFIYISEQIGPEEIDDPEDLSAQGGLF